jgi:hypothetical protein
MGAIIIPSFLQHTNNHIHEVNNTTHITQTSPTMMHDRNHLQTKNRNAVALGFPVFPVLTWEKNVEE